MASKNENSVIARLMALKRMLQAQVQLYLNHIPREEK
jgi:hypothetical protein